MLHQPSVHRQTSAAYASNAPIDLSGKIAMVSGAGGMVGAILAKALARAGAKIMVSDRDEESAARLAQDLVDAGCIAQAHRLRPEMEEDWRDIMAKTEREWGGLNILLHAAASLHFATVEAMSHARWTKMRQINLDAAFIGSRSAFPLMRKADGGGSIIFLSPVEFARFHPKLHAYHSTKGGLSILAETLASHCLSRKYPIRCNAVRLSLGDPDGLSKFLDEEASDEKICAMGLAMLPLGQNGQSSEAIEAVLYLASDQSKSINGKELLLENPTPLPRGQIVHLRSQSYSAA